MRGHRAAAVLLVGCTLSVACSPNPCGNGPTVQPVALDISGASNSPCTVLVTNGDKTLTYEIPAPTPAAADTSLDARAPPTFCPFDAGVAVAGGFRSSAQLCFVGDADLSVLAHARNEAMCPLTVSLTCEGVTLYDRVTWNFCAEFC